MPPRPNPEEEFPLQDSPTDKKQFFAKDELQEQENTRYPSIGEIKKAMPARLFEKSVPLSLYFMVQDFAILAVLYYCHSYFFAFGWLGVLSWWWVTGMCMSALFTVGHDCGHGSFSDYRWLNDLCGHICHVPLLAPYWPWQKSHRLHHTFHAHIEKDYGHPWVTKTDYENRSPVYTWAVKLPISGFIRWFPVYTLNGLPDGSHFWPFSKLFSNNWERFQCVVSTSLCAGFVASVWWYLEGDWARFLSLYLVPVLFHGFWLVMITYLHHQDHDIHVYEDSQWNYVKGAFETIDRPYGFGIDYLLHHISDGHVAHHLFFTQLPHYRLREATAALRTYLSANAHRFPPQLYKRRGYADFLWQFVKLNWVLDYLEGVGGVFSYHRV